MNPSIRHQDASGAAGADVGIFNQAGRLVSVPTCEADETRARQQGYEVLIRCVNHPDTSAVDCTVCVPLD